LQKEPIFLEGTVAAGREKEVSRGTLIPPWLSSILASLLGKAFKLRTQKKILLVHF
jgi:hypothetical protein